MVVSYGRFSTDDQKTGDSRRRQDGYAEAWVKAKGWVVHERVWDEGISAFNQLNVTHGELGKLLKRAEAGKYPRGTYMLVEELDRISRAKTMAGLSLLSRFLVAGFRVVTLAGHSREYSEDDDDSWSWLLAGVTYQTAHHESDKKSERARQSWEGRRQNATIEPMTGVCPAWLTNVKRDEPTDKKSHIINPTRARIVRRIFDEFIAGQGVFSIAGGLRRDGVPAWGNPKKVKPEDESSTAPEKAPFWHKSYVHKILTNPSVIGVIQPCKVIAHSSSKKGHRVAVGDPVKNYYPRVISDEVWLAAVARWKDIKERGKKSPSGPRGKVVPSLFSGLLLCGRTLGPTKVVRKSVGGPLRVYSEAGQGLLGWDYDELETEALGAILSTDAAQLWPEENADGEKEFLSQRIAELTLGIEGATEAIENLLTTLERLSAAAADAVSKRLVTRTEEKESLSKELGECQAQFERITNASSDARDNIAAVRNLFGSRRESQYRDVLRQHVRELISRIVVHFPLAYRQRELDVLEKAMNARKLLTLAQERRAAQGLGMDDFQFRFRADEHRKSLRLAAKIRSRHRHLVIHYKSGATVSTKGTPRGLELEEAPGQIMVEGDGRVWSGFLDIQRATEGHEPGKSPLHDPSLAPSGESSSTAPPRPAKRRRRVAARGKP